MKFLKLVKQVYIYIYTYLTKIENKNTNTNINNKNYIIKLILIFFRIINTNIYSENLRNYFSQFGEIIDCVVMRTDNGMSRCFGFLTFKDPSVIDEILKKKHNLDGKDVNITIKDKKKKEKNKKKKKKKKKKQGQL